MDGYKNRLLIQLSVTKWIYCIDLSAYVQQQFHTIWFKTTRVRRQQFSSLIFYMCNIKSSAAASRCTGLPLTQNPQLRNKKGFKLQNIHPHHHFICLDVCACVFKGDNAVNLKTMLCACQALMLSQAPSFPEVFTPMSSYHIVKHYLCTFL